MKTNKTNGAKKSTSESKNCAKKNCGKSGKSNKQESQSDPDGSYTGVPVKGGRKARPVQDADDL